MVGRGIVRACGHSPRGQAGGQLPRDDVTSVTAVTLKISVATEGLRPFLLCSDPVVPADVELGQAGDSALSPHCSSGDLPPASKPLEQGTGWRKVVRQPGHGEDTLSL